jgi:hypothetical protein
MAQLVNVLNRRAANFQRKLSDDESVAAYTEIVSDAQEAVDGLARITPPGSLHKIHADAVQTFDLVVNWLGMELEYRKTLNFIHQENANALLPEVNAKMYLLPRDVADAKWVLNLP